MLQTEFINSSLGWNNKIKTTFASRVFKMNVLSFDFKSNLFCVLTIFQFWKLFNLGQV